MNKIMATINITVIIIIAILTIMVIISPIVMNKKTTILQVTWHIPESLSTFALSHTRYFNICH